MPEFNDPFALNAIISNAESQNTYASLSSYNAVVNVEPIINETPPPVVFPVRGSEGLEPDGLFNYECRPLYKLEKHVSVIRKGPTMPPKIQMYSWEDEDDISQGGTGDDSISVETSFNGADMPQKANHEIIGFNGVQDTHTYGTAIDLGDKSIFYNEFRIIKDVGDTIILPITNPLDMDWDINMVLKVTHQYIDNFNNTQTATCRCAITNLNYTNVFINNPPNFNANFSGVTATYNTDGPFITPGGVECTILAISPNFPVNAITINDVYTVSAELPEPLFEFKFTRFAYRYKYDDGEYSVFSPWSEVAFMPSDFDFLPKKGYNLGMVNNMRTLKVLDWNPKDRPRDVVEIDILYKESNSPNVYTVETFKPDQLGPGGTPADNPWNTGGTGGHKGRYSVTSELIHKTLPSNQMLRPWDNVPRKALAQEITANRLIYGNYVQNYDNVDVTTGDPIAPSFSLAVDKFNYSIDSNIEDLSKQPLKSLKSMRTYQLGVVYRDRYGRETPVLTSQSGSIEIPKVDSKMQNRISIGLTSSPPSWAESYTFYIKETSNEYYNLAMDRWYDAEDDGIWISFPSSERNKVSERSILLLKKQHDSDVPVSSNIKYKVLDIKNNAPTFIKTEYQYWGAIPMMPVPPGWGQETNAGTLDTGMFHVTGLPLPNRLYIDVYAEYFDQSVLHGLTNKSGAQVRITQSGEGTATGYNMPASATTNKSLWYDVAKISYIGSPAETYIDIVDAPSGGGSVEIEKEIPGQAEQIVRITLENIMGNDLGFCEPDSSTSLSIANGISLEARTKIVKEKAQFEGRFFVKIFRDPEITEHIVRNSQKAEDAYQVLASRDIRYISIANPGVQEWRTDAANTYGAYRTSQGDPARWSGNLDEVGSASSYNYIPINKQWQHVNVGNIKVEVSSLHENAGAAEYYDSANVLSTPPQDPTMDCTWPAGPGYFSNQDYTSGWFFRKFYDFINLDISRDFADHKQSTISTPAYSTWLEPDTQSATPSPHHAGNTYTGGSIWPDCSDTQNNWPSFYVNDHEPVTCGGTDLPCSTIDTTWCTNEQLTGDGSLVLSLHNHQLVNPQVSGDGAPGYKHEKGGANPLQVPAIWGDQQDLLGYTGNAGSPTALTDNGDVTITRTYPATWQIDTIEKLRSGWYYLFHGRDKVADDWPVSRFSSQRWFFDKVGSANKYSGNGIWDETIGGVTVSKIDLGFYGIGTLTTDHRSHEMATHQDAEQAFGELMATPGTQFRFRQDPNQIVYTVTNSKIEDYIFNYETAHGSWSAKDGTDASGNTIFVGGGGIGDDANAPSSSLYLKTMFISDMFNFKRELQGGAMYNYRVRVTLTLDKQIGSEGISLGTANIGFHPLKNHVNIDGNCNIKEGPQIYSMLGPSPSDGWRAEANWFPSAIGGTQTVYRFYNLSSYWNYIDPSTPGVPPASGQSSDMGVGDIDGQHFGLHERGLNTTTIEVISPYKGDEGVKRMSNNPAIWETEPMEDVGLDIYYAASPTYPIKLSRFRSDLNQPDTLDVDVLGNTTEAHYFDYGWRGEEIVPVGCIAKASGVTPGHTYTLTGGIVNGVQGDLVWVQGAMKLDASMNAVPLTVGDKVRFEWNGEGSWYGAKQDPQFIEADVLGGIDTTLFRIQSNTHNNRRSLNYFNCYSFSNGVESNRVRDDYNAVQIDKGVKASMPLATPYEEERRASSLIFSGIYNSTSGINNTNQFIQAEPITKDINPINGSIQKLFARDTDLVTFCENKVFKILAKKDALFNADGNTNVTSNQAVLGQSIPFTGEYGISRNPESFASESYRVYFTDKSRGAVLRLSRDGITPISEAGMKDWFKDNLFRATNLIGSFDDRQGHYNLTLESIDGDGINYAYTASYTEEKKGWVSFKSFVHQDGLSHKNVYYTFPSTNYSLNTGLDPWGDPYSDTGVNTAELHQHHVDITTKRLVTSTALAGSAMFAVSIGPGMILPGMNVEGNGIPYGTTVSGYDEASGLVGLSIPNYATSAWPIAGDEITFTSPRNMFYDNTSPRYSMVKTVFNQDQGTVKRFKTINYEGTQGQVVPKGGALNTVNQYQIHDSFSGVQHNTGYIIEDNFQKDGWYVHNLKTDIQEGTIREFAKKENKWFDYIKGVDKGGGDNLDTGDFSLQGLGFATTII